MSTPAARGCEPDQRTSDQAGDNVENQTSGPPLNQGRDPAVCDTRLDEHAGCPTVNVYITPSSPWNWQVRRYSTTQCQARLIVTAAGQTLAHPAGSVLGTYQYIVGSGAGSWTRVSGDGPPTLPI